MKSIKGRKTPENGDQKTFSQSFNVKVDIKASSCFKMVQSDIEMCGMSHFTMYHFG